MGWLECSAQALESGKTMEDFGQVAHHSAGISTHFGGPNLRTGSCGVCSEGLESCSRPVTGIVLPPVGSMDLEARSTWAVDWLPLPGQQPCKRV